MVYMLVRNKVCNTRKKQRRLINKYNKTDKKMKPAIDKCKI